MVDQIFAGRVALVTGAASGIGFATAKRLLDRGATVWATDLRQEALEEAYQGVANANISPLDVTDSAGVDALVARISDQSGALHVVVNAAGVPAHPRHGIPTEFDLTRVTDDDFDFVMRVNLAGPFYVIRAAIPLIQKNGAQGGSIVNISSVGALMAVSIHAPYVASKAGLLGLTRTLAHEYAKDNIRINAIAPGSTDTAMVPTDPEFRKFAADFSPLRRIATPDELAATIVYLASDDAAFMTGQTVSPNGGSYM
ncbi:SDR family NAD(P)-dependent oxidoreductase [Arthrobacter sp. YN]|uniref:SDR family NAD(P)-dependent oxidoreductase n=1 Tax=Arthrobacter sp. YN TaxID=2020486 RepID=UPI000B61A542|nr:SDR family oxidoreductase [Arthrobacter sp. YN]ASN20144.1 short-chain dehydrogenase [Arthrobacter sp. YN]